MKPLSKQIRRVGALRAILHQEHITVHNMNINDFLSIAFDIEFFLPTQSVHHYTYKHCHPLFYCQPTMHVNFARS